MNAYKTIDTNKYRIQIYRDECALNPLKMTDDPISLFFYGGKYNEPGFIHNANLPEDKEWERLYFSYNDAYGTSRLIDGRYGSSGFIATEKETWEKYAGSPYNKEVLEECYKELEFYFAGECFGYQVFQKIIVDGKTFIGDEEIDSCWSFYGEESLMDYIKQYTLG